jgi:hypothetical protein
MDANTQRRSRPSARVLSQLIHASKATKDLRADIARVFQRMDEVAILLQEAVHESVFADRAGDLATMEQLRAFALETRPRTRPRKR